MFGCLAAAGEATAAFSSGLLDVALLDVAPLDVALLDAWDALAWLSWVGGVWLIHPDECRKPELLKRGPKKKRKRK